LKPERWPALPKVKVVVGTMDRMGPVERVQSVLAGRTPDRPPIGFWHHFQPDQTIGPAAVDAHVNHLETYDLDFLKVMNDNGYPHAAAIEGIADLASLTVLRGDELQFASQLDVLSGLKRTLKGRELMTTTIFNAWSVLRRLIRPTGGHKPPNMDGAEDEPSARIREFLRQDAAAVRRALQTIGTSLSHFARRCLDAGADGIFLSVRDDWVESPGRPTGRYAELVRPSDLEILNAAAAGRFNMLHVCAQAVDFRAFGAYPVHAINWADRAAGPSIADVRDWLRPALCGGLDNLRTLPDGTPDDCERQVQDALQQAGGRPIIIAPGCTYEAERVPHANLQAVCGAVRRLTSTSSTTEGRGPSTM
jgi:uroporphyrinogen decarboxylase